MFLWAASRARGYAWVRRSKSFRGLIPHFGYAEELNDHLIIVEYVPPEKQLWTLKNLVIVFQGQYKATVMRRIAGASFPDLKTATHWATQRASVPPHCSSDVSQPWRCSYCGRRFDDTE